MDALAIQHREIQKKESDLFKSYFKFITYLRGGFASGFNHVEEEVYTTRLLRVHKNKESSRTGNTAVISEVELSSGSIHSNAVYILDTDEKIFQWQGKHSTPIQRVFAAETIAHLNSSFHHGAAEVIVVEQGSGDREFFNILGSEEALTEDEEESEEEEEEEYIVEDKKLFCLSSSGPFGLGHLKFSAVAEGKITQDMFDTNDVFIFDIGHQVYTWIGKHASRKERKHGLEYAQNYVKGCEGRSAFTPICQVVEGGEDELFLSSLEGWQGW